MFRILHSTLILGLAEEVSPGDKVSVGTFPVEGDSVQSPTHCLKTLITLSTYLRH
jgi:hypothetical protein